MILSRSLSLLTTFAPFVLASGIKPRIIDGNAADRATYPKSVVMVVNRVKQLDCGGTLVSPTLVLTAAHCSGGIIDYVMVGRYNTVNPLEDFETIPIVNEIIHPEFDRSTFNFDVMLLQLEYSPTKVSEYMPLNSIDVIPPVGVDLTAMGWGKTQPNGQSDAPILQEVDLPTISNEDCNSKERGEESFVGKVKENMICTFAPNADHCYGDSGGPLLIRSAFNQSQVIQAGIISWGGDNCADGFFPGVGQRTSTSYEWISGVICAIDFENPSTKSRYSCNDDETFSPMPSAAPIEPTISPAPTFYTVNVWIELHMDKWPEDIRWTLIDMSSGIPLASSGSYKDSTEDIILTNVKALPERTYAFQITDSFGDGFALGGFYRLRMGGVDLDTSEILFEGNLEDEAVHTFITPDETAAPSMTFHPTDAPSESPSLAPTSKPTHSPTLSPTTLQTSLPPTNEPTRLPTSEPTMSPTVKPTATPSASPSTPPPPTSNGFDLGESFRNFEGGFPSLINFTSAPTVSPSSAPTGIPTMNFTETPTDMPTINPTKVPTVLPTTKPTKTQTVQPTTSVSNSDCGDVGDSCSSWSQCCSNRCVIGLCARPDLDDSVRSIGEGPLPSIESPIEVPSPTASPTEPSGFPLMNFADAVESFIGFFAEFTEAIGNATVETNTTDAPSSAPNEPQCTDVGGSCHTKEECCSDRCIIGLCAIPAGRKLRGGDFV